MILTSILSHVGQYDFSVLTKFRFLRGPRTDERDGIRPSSANQGRYVYYLMIRMILCFGMFLYSSSCYYHHQIESIHLSHCCHIFPWLCAWDVCYIIFCYIVHKQSGKKREFVFIIIVQFLMGENDRMHFGLKIVFVYLYIAPSHYYHCANLSEDIGLKKCLSDIFCQVCKIKHILSVIHYTICGAVCFQFTHFPCDDWENIYTLSYYHHRIGSMNYYPLFIVRTKNWNIALDKDL